MGARRTWLVLLAAPVCGLPALFARISSKPGRFFGWGTATSKFEFGLAFFFQLLIVKRL